MSEFKKPNSEKEFAENFAQIKPEMNDTEAYYESSRCLFCYDAPCMHACPTHIDIPLFIRQINSKNSLGAAKTIYNQNWFGHACGKVCPTEVLCEGACVYHKQGVKPIEIGRLQAYTTEKAIGKNIKLFDVGKPNGKKIAAIGAGPAGISCACELRCLGYAVDIYEAKEKPSGLTVYGVAPYKITNEAALAEIDYLQKQFGFNITYNNPVSTRKQLDELEKNYDAIFIGIGLGRTSNLNIPGENLKNCFGAVEFIEKLRMNHHNVKIGKKVIVLGGGNTAMDAASESCRMGAEKVIIAYRRSRKEMGAYNFEFDLAKNAGATGLFNVIPVDIIDDGKGKVKGIKFIRNNSSHEKIINIPGRAPLKTKKFEADEPERSPDNYRDEHFEGEVQRRNSKFLEVPGSEFVEECNMVILATGQSKQVEFLEIIAKIKPGKKGNFMDSRGRIIVNEQYQTNNPKYFAAGDAVNGGVEVVNAAAEAKIAAKGIHEWITKK